MSQEEPVQPPVPTPFNQEEQLENIIESYLIKKGFQKRLKSYPNASDELAFDKLVTQASFLSEINVANYINFYNPNEKFPCAYQQSYQELKDYVYNSASKRELNAILYPLFVYYFLSLIERNYIIDANKFFQQHCRDHVEQNERELSLIYEIQSIEQMNSSELVRLWRNNKYIVRMNAATFNALIEFLFEKRFMMLISQINMYLSIQIAHTIPSLPSNCAIYSDKKPPCLSETARHPSIKLYTLFNTQNQLVDISVSGDGTMIAGCFGDSMICMWDSMRINPSVADAGWTSKLNRHYTELVGHSAPIYSLAFSPDNEGLLSASADRTVRAWSMTTKTCTGCYYGHTRPIWHVQYSPEGYYFATASNDHTARLWAIDKKQSLRIFVGHFADVNTVAFHPNGHYLLTGSSDKSTRFWEITTGSCVRVFPDKQPLISVKITPGGKSFISSSEGDKCASVWDLSSGEKVMELKGHQKPVWCLDIDSSDSVVVTGSEDGSVRLWDLRMINEAYHVFRSQNTSQKLIGASLYTPALSNVQLDQDSTLGAYHTKHTPVYTVKFGTNNLIFAAGPHRER